MDDTPRTRSVSGAPGGTGAGPGPRPVEPPGTTPAGTRGLHRPLDRVDREILRLLQTDGRMSVRTLAERVHVSRANAYARLSRLLDEGVIRGFTTLLDPERAGFHTSAYITLKIEQDTWRDVREQLLRLPGAEHVALVSGDFDVLLLVRCADNQVLREVVFHRIQGMPGVRSTRTLLVFDETDRIPRLPG